MFRVETSQNMTEAQRVEAYREFHAGHLRRQTSAQETIKTLLIVWTVLGVLAGVFMLLSVYGA